MIDDEKIIDLFFKRDQQGIREMDNKYGAVCHNLSYNIVKIVRNISLKIYWRKEAAKRSGHYTIALEEIEGYIADQKTVEDEIEVRELARIIGDFLDTLTLENRVIFMRRYWFADSYKGIAEFMGLSEKNISVRLTKESEKAPLDSVGSYGGLLMSYRSGGIYTSPFHWKRYPQHTTRCHRKCLRVYNGGKRCSLSSDFFF